MKSARIAAFTRGILDQFPLAICCAPLGISIGALTVSSGLPGWWAVAMSAFVFTGAGQLMAVSSLLGGISAPVVLLSLLLMNSRHLVMTTSAMPRLSFLPQPVQYISAALLADEPYACLMSKPRNELSLPYIFGMQVPFYLLWVLATALGTLVHLDTLSWFENLAAWGLVALLAYLALAKVFASAEKISLIKRLERRETRVRLALFAGVGFLSVILGQFLPFKLGVLLSAVLGVFVVWRVHSDER